MSKKVVRKVDLDIKNELQRRKRDNSPEFNKKVKERRRIAKIAKASRKHNRKNR